MWQRFTERARQVVLFGQEEAGKMNAAHVGTEHLLLGLVRESDGLAAQILQMMGVELQNLRSEIESQSSAVSGVPEPKLTPKAKRALELAANEARRTKQDCIDTEHLLLALLREKDDLAANVLRKLGLDLKKTRRLITALSLDPNSSAYAPALRLSAQLVPKARRIFGRAADEAFLMNHNVVAPEHFLLALLREEDGVAAKILGEAGLDLESVRERVLQERDAE